MSVFQILKNNVLIIDGNQQYSDTVDNFLLDAGAVSVPESVIYDDAQECCVVDGDFRDYPNGTYSGYCDRIQDLLDAHPVGSYYWSNDSTSPATLFGGTWESLPAGYTLIAQGSGTDDFGSFNYVAGTKYGERMHKLTTDELPHIRGDVLDFARQDPNQKLTTHGVFSAPASIENVSFGSNPQSGQGDGFVMDFGKDVPHNNLSPCVAAYVWRRTA